MSDEKKSDKIDRVSASTGTQRINPTEAIRSVDAVRPTAGVQGVARTGGVRSAHRTERALTRTERDKLLGMIREEADKLFGGGALPKHQREVVKRAVTMAVDAGIIVSDEEDEKKPSEDVSGSESDKG